MWSGEGWGSACWAASIWSSWWKRLNVTDIFVTQTHQRPERSISQHSKPSLCSGLSSDSLHWFFLLPLATTCLLSQSLAIPVRLLRSEECGLQCHWPLVHRPFRMVEDRLQSTAVPWFFMYFIEITVQIRKKLEGCWVPFRRS